MADWGQAIPDLRTEIVDIAGEEDLVSRTGGGLPRMKESIN